MHVDLFISHPCHVSGYICNQINETGMHQALEFRDHKAKVLASWLNTDQHSPRTRKTCDDDAQVPAKRRRLTGDEWEDRGVKVGLECLASVCTWG
jgi:hypothetical protein